MAEDPETPYILIRKNVKNINLHVKPDGSVVVSASPSVPKKYIDDFVRAKQSFIEKARLEMKQNGKRRGQLVSGETIPYLGAELVLQVENTDRRYIPIWIEKLQQGCITSFSRNNQGEAVFCQNGRLYLYTQHTDDPAYKQRLYDAWQKIQAGVLCEKISRQYYPVFEKLGVAYPQIKIRKMSSRWGSCIPGKHRITFNSLLLEKSLQSVEYVVVHEFSHFIHPNHSAEFYEFVSRILPDWKKRKEELN